jgi:multiple sugar transport system substrate-binding protein
MKNQASKFTELTGINVVWDYVAWDAFQGTFMTEATAGAGNYDLLVWIDAWGAGAKNYLEPLDNYIKRDGIDMSDYPEGFLQTVKIGTDNYYGFPHRGNGLILFYNKAIFDELGITPPATWDDFVTVSKKIEEKKGIKGTALPYTISNGQNLMVWYSMLWGNGGDLFDEKWEPIFNSPEGVKATQDHIDFLLKHKIIPEGAKTWTEGEALTEMLQGRSAMSVTWSWRYESLTNPKEVVKGVLGNVGMAPVPVYPNQKSPISYATNFAISMSKDSKNKDAAWEYLKFLCDAKVEKSVVTDKSNPDTSTVVTMHTSNLLDPEINKLHDNLQNVTNEVLKTSRALPVTPMWLQVQGALEVAMNKMASGEPVKETLDAAAAEVRQIMDRAGYYKK